MDTSCLYPPNCRSLSDNVIGSVVLRTQTSRVSLKHDTNSTSTSTEPPSSVLFDQMTHHHFVPSSSMKNSPKHLLKGATSSVESPGTTQELLILQRKVRHRERCRINQARYREKQRRIKTGIEEKVHKLRQEIQLLESTRDKFCCIPTTPTIWVLAAEYLRYYQYYLAGPQRLDKDKTALTFLQETMATQSNSITGAESEMEKWRQISFCFDDIRVDLSRLEMPDANVVVASTTMRVSISATTFRYAFPHLHRCEETGVKSGEWPRVALKLLGKRLVVRGSSRFYWDNTSNRIVNVDIEGDLLTPMLSVLGNLEDVSCLFDRALLTHDFRLTNKP